MDLWKLNITFRSTTTDRFCDFCHWSQIQKFKSQIRSVVVRQVGRILTEKINWFICVVHSKFCVNLTKIFPVVAKIGLPVLTYRTPNLCMLKSVIVAYNLRGRRQFWIIVIVTQNRMLPWHMNVVGKLWSICDRTADTDVDPPSKKFPSNAYNWGSNRLLTMIIDLSLGRGRVETVGEGAKQCGCLLCSNLKLSQCGLCVILEIKGICVMLPYLLHSVYVIWYLICRWLCSAVGTPPSDDD